MNDYSSKNDLLPDNAMVETTLTQSITTTNIGRYLLRNFLVIINKQSVLIAVISVILTYLSFELEFYADVPTAFIGIAIIFPIVFSINSAYKRREEALSYFASILAHSAAIFYAHRDWVRNRNEMHIKNVSSLFISLFNNFKDYFTGVNTSFEKMSQIYSIFSDFSISNEKLREEGVSPPEMARINQYFQIIILNFEKMRAILTYRTPLALRAYSRFFLNVSPLLFAPYFANLAVRFDNSIFGYGMAILFSIVLVSLDKIQDDLENPYDTIGKDDIRFDDALSYIKTLNNQSEKKINPNISQ